MLQRHSANVGSCQGLAIKKPGYTAVMLWLANWMADRKIVFRGSVVSTSCRAWLSAVIA